VAALFAPTDLDAVTLGDDVAAASALKMCYAAWTKGTSALLLAIRATAAAHGVDAALVAEWARTQPGLTARSQAAAGTARKAWRFAGEMDQIAACFAEAGLPDGFARAAAEVYRRLAASRTWRVTRRWTWCWSGHARGVRGRVLDTDAAAVVFAPMPAVYMGREQIGVRVEGAGEVDEVRSGLASTDVVTRLLHGPGKDITPPRCEGRGKDEGGEQVLALGYSHPHQHGRDAPLVVSPFDASAVAGTFSSAQLGHQLLPVGLRNGPALEGFTAMAVVNKVAGVVQFAGEGFHGGAESARVGCFFRPLLDDEACALVPARRNSQECCCSVLGASCGHLDEPDRCEPAYQARADAGQIMEVPFKPIIGEILGNVLGAEAAAPRWRAVAAGPAAGRSNAAHRAQLRRDHGSQPVRAVRLRIEQMPPGPPCDGLGEEGLETLASGERIMHREELVSQREQAPARASVQGRGAMDQAVEPSALLLAASCLPSLLVEVLVDRVSKRSGLRKLARLRPGDAEQADKQA
jgi:hypothetical protein